MDIPPTEPEAIKPRPDYPPKTPPPPKKPPNPPPPDPPRTELLEGLPVPQRAGRTGHPVMKNRQGASWTLEAQPWSAPKAARHVADQLANWGLTVPSSLDEVVCLLATTVIGDGGRRISVHLSEQGGMALILCLSHQRAHVDETTDVLAALHKLGAESCGTEMTAEGRQVWTLLPVRMPAAAGIPN